MPDLSNEPFACPFATQNDRRCIAVLVVQALLLAGCASPAFERSQVASDDASKRRNDALTCTGSDERLTGWLAEAMLMGLTVGGGPAVIESENAVKRKAFKKCMDARQTKPVL